MSKAKLPKHWIVLNSKSHPDRVYYFNVRTNQSSWDEPTADTPVKQRRTSKDSSSVQSEPVSPDHDAFDKKASKRRILVAKRTVKRTEEKDTPQMQVLREKLLKRKEMTASSKKGLTGTKETNKLTQSSPSKSKPKGKNQTSTCVSETDTGNSGKVEVCTPQMRAIYEKMQQKGLKVNASARKETENNNETTSVDNEKKNREEEPVKLWQPKRLSVTSPRAEISDCPSTSKRNIETRTTRSSTFGAKNDGLCAKKTEIQHDFSSKSKTGVKLGRKVFKKNLGKERMEKLRKSLSLERQSLESSNNDDATSDSIGEGTSTTSNSSVLSSRIYKNAENRLTSLKHKLAKSKNPFDSTKYNAQLDELKDVEPDVETTVDKLVKRANETAFCEEMDWEPMEDEKITNEVQSVRIELGTDITGDAVSTVPRNTLEHPLSLQQKEKQQLYIVVDTNVLLTNIDAVELARETDFKTYDRPIIVIPWTVIRELDYIKDNRSKTKSAALCAKARKAVQYLNNLFSSKHPRVIGQTPEEVAKNKEKFATDCPDDEILQTCLQIRDFGKCAVLLSYDKNLCNKAMVHDIVTFGRNDPFEKIDYLNLSDAANQSFHGCTSSVNKRQSLQASFTRNSLSSMLDELFDEAKTVIQEFLTVIVTKEMSELYGASWEKYVVLRPPWTPVTVLQCAVRHWIGVISDSFLRKAEVILKELLKIFRNFSGIGRTVKEVSFVLDKCGDLVQMTNIDKYPDLMQRTSRKINELKQKCYEYEIQSNKKILEEAIGIEENVLEQKRRADKSLQYFELAYTHARNMCGLAAEAAGIPCSIQYEIPDPLPSAEEISKVQPELATNVNRLINALGTVIEEVDNSCLGHRALISLYQSLVTFLPEITPATLSDDLTPLDVYCCVKQKEEVLRAGLRQLQELSTQYCRFASYRPA